MLPIFVVNCFGGVHVACTPPKQVTAKMGNMYSTKTINYKDEQHVHHQNN
jgi:hypothetical protein